MQVILALAVPFYAIRNKLEVDQRDGFLALMGAWHLPEVCP
jgi:hypothetical protein